jgi:predicted PurR-regulated permease PerM
MRKWILLALFLILTPGCVRFNPQANPNFNPKIENQNGKIDEIKSNQNGVMTEIGNLKKQIDVQNSKLKEFQDGLINLNTAISRNENSGVQILQGDGALIMIFSLSIIAMLLYWYRDRAVVAEKTNSIMAKEIARFNDAHLNDNILRSAMNTEAEEHVFHLLTKNVKDLN